MTGILSSVLERSTLRRWSRVVERLDALDPAALSRLRSRARRLSQRLDEVIHVAEGRLATPGGGAPAVRRPLHSDWAWRPEIWAGPIRPAGLAPVRNRDCFGSEAKIFHDCDAFELSLRQVRNVAADGVAPFGLRFDVFHFEGSFLSLVIDMPAEAVDDLTRRHILRLDLIVEAEAQLELFGRLNLRHGPNTEQLVREIPMTGGTLTVDFDLSEVSAGMGALESAWLDVIFEGPELNQVVLRDLTMSRRPRAEI